MNKSKLREIKDIMGYQGHPVPDYKQWQETSGPEMLERMQAEGVEALLLAPA